MGALDVHLRMLEVLYFLQRLCVAYLEGFTSLERSLLVSNTSREDYQGFVLSLYFCHRALLSLLHELVLYSLDHGSEFETENMDNALVRVCPEHKSSFFVLEPEGDEAKEVVVQGRGMALETMHFSFRRKHLVLQQESGIERFLVQHEERFRV